MEIQLRVTDRQGRAHEARALVDAAWLFGQEYTELAFDKAIEAIKDELIDEGAFS